MSIVAGLWINTSGEHARQKNAGKTMIQLGLSHFRVGAHEPSNMPSTLYRKEPNYTPEIVYARMCSHLKAQHRAWTLTSVPKTTHLKEGDEGYTHNAAKQEWFLIVEDDMVFAGKSVQDLQDLIRSCPENAEVIQLYCCNPDVYPSLIASEECVLPWSSEKWHTGAYLISAKGLDRNVKAFVIGGGTGYDFRETQYPTNPEAVVFGGCVSYIATKPLFCVNETIPSIVYPDRISDQLYVTNIIRNIHRRIEDGPMFVFILAAGSFTSNASRLLEELNKELYINISNESVPVLAWASPQTVKEGIEIFRPSGVTRPCETACENTKALLAKINKLSESKLPGIGDTGNYYLPYVPYLLTLLGDRVKFVCLRDDRLKCVNAYMDNTTSRHHWIDHEGDNYIADGTWDKCFPKYPQLLLKSDMIGKYWDEYYETSQQHQDAYPERFRVFSATKLDIPSIFKFLGIVKRVPR